MKAIKIISNNRISNSTSVLKFKRCFDFKAGQIIKITTDDLIPPRMYSILSSETNENIEILYKIEPEGTLTPKLNLLVSGDEIYISEPSGKFISTYGPAWFIAAGTGIAPFVSMILSGYGANKKLIHGNKNQSELYFSELLTRLLSENYISCCSTEKGENSYHGHVTDYLKSLSVLPKDNKYYICGSAEMVVDTRDVLIDKGVSFQNILSEIYF
jgi:ferredoxin--NADP+ reductase